MAQRMSLIVTVVLVLAVSVLGYALYAERQTREEAVLGAKFDALTLSMYQAKVLVLKMDPSDKEALQRLVAAEACHEMAWQMYKKHDWNETRRYLNALAERIEETVRCVDRDQIVPARTLLGSVIRKEGAH